MIDIFICDIFDLKMYVLSALSIFIIDALAKFVPYLTDWTTEDNELPRMNISLYHSMIDILICDIFY